MTSKNLLKEAERVFDIEARAIDALKSRLDQGFEAAVDLISTCQGKVIFCGMGKSGLIGRKISSTLSSTGTPSIFLHPAESSHGDLGIISKGDLLIALSYSGETKELSTVLTYCLRKEIPIIAITGGSKSALAQASTVLLDVSVSQEACPMGLAPTASTTATLAMGDALAMTVLLKRGFQPQDYAELHPGGSLGARLLTRVEDVMHTGDSLPLVALDTNMKDVISKMTRREVRGVAGVLDAQGVLTGVITDGDIRRRLDRSVNPLTESAADMMALNPKMVDKSELAEKALFMMEQFTIQVLFVVDRASSNPKHPIGIVHLQDLVKAKVR